MRGPATRRGKIAAGAAAAAATVGIAFGISQGGGGIDVFVGSNPTPSVTATATPTPTPTAGGSCSATITGGNVGNALLSIPAGGTLCLHAGTYTYDASITKTTQTTVTASSGVAASDIVFSSFRTNTSSRLTFDHVTIGVDGVIGSGNPDSGTGSTHLYVTNSRVIRPGSLCIVQSGPSNADILIDGVDFGNTNAEVSPGDVNCDGGEGRLDIQSGCSSCGFVIRNSTFGPGGAADGIQVRWGVDGVTIGPGNYFNGIVEEQCGDVHCDSIQPYGASHLTVTGNYFKNDSTIIADFDCRSGGGGTSPINVTNNVMDQQTISAASAVNYVDVHPGDSFSHNTLSPSTEFQIYGGNQGCASSGVTVQNNVLGGGCTIATGTHTIDHNLAVGGGVCAGGTGGLTGTATFVGGSSPTTLGGWALAATSLGRNAASDGSDMGAPVSSMTGAWP